MYLDWQPIHGLILQLSADHLACLSQVIAQHPESVTFPVTGSP